jgi:hypothetical protein
MLSVMKHDNVVQKIRICNECNKQNKAYEQMLRDKKAILNIEKKTDENNLYMPSSSHPSANLNQLNPETLRRPETG